MPPKQDLVQLATIGAPHGVRGEVRLKAFTGDPMALSDYGPLLTGDGRAFTVLQLRPAKEVVVARLAEVTSREAAQALTGQALFVPRASLPDDLAEDEFYHVDLIGLRAEDLAGEPVGKVVAVHDFGGGEMLEIAPPKGRALMVPFTRAAVPAVDIAAGFIRLDPVAAGLVPDEDAPQGQGPDGRGPDGQAEDGR